MQKIATKNLLIGQVFEIHLGSYEYNEIIKKLPKELLIVQAVQ